MKYLSLIIITLFVSCFGKRPQNTGKEGKLLPSFNILLPDSISLYNTNNIPTGKPIALLLFGPHCPYSKAQIEDILKNIHKLNDIHFYVFTPAPFIEMKEFYKKYQLDRYANITTGIDIQNFFSNYISAQGVPYIAIYDENKRLKKAFVGKLEISDLNNAIR